MERLADADGDFDDVKPVALLALALSLAPAASAIAASEAPLLAVTAPGAPTRGVPDQLKSAERDQYRAVFASIRASNWADAIQRLDAMPDGLLTPFARAELFAAKGSPRASGEALQALLNRAPELPQAEDLARLARTRGANALPELPVARDLIRLPGASRRIAARTNRSDRVAMELRPQVINLIKTDQPAQAEALLIARQADLTEEARTEWQQRIAWSYYLTGDDTNARRLAAQAQQGLGEWKAQADWVAGLAAWRQRDYQAAGQAFDAVTAHARDYEMRAAGLFWSARSDMAIGRPNWVQPKLRTAARLPETFYGLLAASSLGIAATQDTASMALTGLASVEWQGLARYPNVRVAAALSEIGEDAFADEVLRYQARIGAPTEHAALLHLAAKLDLPATQIWLAQNGPRGADMPVSSRYPVPAWTPQGGWRVDPALVYAHALQESQFRTTAVSSAGAIGLMQIMPGTAQLIARRKGEAIDRSQLNRPAVAFEYGQSYLEMLRDMPGTQGLLPKIIAAYNAGPGSVMAWNYKVRDGGDPLLFIESIPFVETRAYVAIVLRNYWMYSRQQGQAAGSLKAIAQGMWPRFPGLPGKTAVRLDSEVAADTFAASGANTELARAN
ncbi:MAG: lytic transglycosylase domain-containing protein [Sphingomonadaceae bacterium]